MATSSPPLPGAPVSAPAYASWIFWLDGLGGLAVGLLVLAVSGWLAPWYGMPRALVLMTGVVNLIYGAAGLSVARLAVKPAWVIRAMAGANLGWAVVSVGLLVAFGETARWPGLAYVALEGAYVAVLGAAEWRLAKGAPEAPSAGRIE